MAITVSGTAITFNDATTQTTAASPSSYAGAGGQVFTSSGTFTIPTGVTSLKVSVVGGGGGGGYAACCAIVTGSAGNTSSVSSGTQTISTVSATGGAGGYPSGIGYGGLGSGGNLNMRGSGTYPASPGGGHLANLFGTNGTSNFSPLYGGGGYPTSVNSAGGAGGSAIKFLTGLTAGNTITVTVGAASAAPYSGAAGIVVFEW